MACKGYISGFADGTFGPDQPVRRGEYTTMVVRSFLYFLNLLNPPTPHFTDVDQSNIFYQAIETANAKHDVDGQAVVDGYDPSYCQAHTSRGYPCFIVTTIIAIYSNGHDLALTYAREPEGKLGGQLHYGQL